MVPVTSELPSYLPDLCLVNIFGRIPLRDLLCSVRAVCTNWTRLVPTDLARRRTVALAREYSQLQPEAIRSPLEQYWPDGLFELVRRDDDGSPWSAPAAQSHDQLCFNALLVPGATGELTEAFTGPLMATLPNITRLTVAQCSFAPKSMLLTVLRQLVRLFAHYRLHSLRLDLSDFIYAENIDRVQLDTAIIALFDSIDQLGPSLRHLTLNVSLPGLTQPNTVTTLPERINLSILSRLDTLTSHCTIEGSSWLMGPIRRHAAAGRVTIDCEPFLALDVMAGLKPQLAAKFTSAHVLKAFTVAHYAEMCLIGQRFSCLTRLAVSQLDSMPMTMLARALSPLVQLVHLRIETLCTLPEDESPEPEHLAQLGSVRLLHLKFITRSHLDTSRLHLPQLFPALQVLSLDQFSQSCRLCDYDLSVDGYVRCLVTDETRDRIVHCSRLAREPLHACARLHTVNVIGDRLMPYLMYSL